MASADFKEASLLYCVEMEVSIPSDVDGGLIEGLKTAEKERSQGLQRDGRWVHLWRVAGRYANISVFDVADHDELHGILSSLPLFPFMSIKVTPLAKHPSAIK